MQGEQEQYLCSSSSCPYYGRLLIGPSSTYDLPLSLQSPPRIKSHSRVTHLLRHRCANTLPDALLSCGSFKLFITDH